MVTFNQLIKKPRRKKYHFTRSGALRSCPHKKGVCIRVYTTSPKKPNSAVRKVAKVRLTSTGRNVLAAIPGFGHNLSEHSVVLLRGGRVPDLPGVRYRLIRGKYDFIAKENVQRKARRSKFGIVRSSKSAR
jgi:small subunit ribosomal protein S12